jgi:hypothetical protein
VQGGRKEGEYSQSAKVEVSESELRNLDVRLLFVFSSTSKAFKNLQRSTLVSSYL